jgi:hypothetical protein
MFMGSDGQRGASCPGFLPLTDAMPSWSAARVKPQAETIWKEERCRGGWTVRPHLSQHADGVAWKVRGFGGPMCAGTKYPTPKPLGGRFASCPNLHWLPRTLRSACSNGTSLDNLISPNWPVCPALPSLRNTKTFVLPTRPPRRRHSLTTAGRFVDRGPLQQEVPCLSLTAR